MYHLSEACFERLERLADAIPVVLLMRNVKTKQHLDRCKNDCSVNYGKRKSRKLKKWGRLKFEYRLFRVFFTFSVLQKKIKEIYIYISNVKTYDSYDKGYLLKIPSKFEVNRATGTYDILSASLKNEN